MKKLSDIDYLMNYKSFFLARQFGATDVINPKEIKDSVRRQNKLKNFYLFKF